MTARTRLSSWLRKNRWGLWLFLPALTLVIATASMRFYTFYWIYRPHIDRGLSLSVTREAEGIPYPIVATVSLENIQQVTSHPDFDVPYGANLWLVDVHFAAPPESVVDICDVLAFDTTGRRFAPVARKSTWFYTPVCTPENSPGALAPGSLPHSSTDTPRPAEWTIRFAFVAPPDAVPDWLRISFDADYLRIPLA